MGAAVASGAGAGAGSGSGGAGPARSAVVDDELWSAIGDPTRRRLLDLVLAAGAGGPGAGGGSAGLGGAGGAATATSLAAQLPVTRQAVAKHLAVLDRAGLVRATPAGRERRYRVDEEQLARAAEQLAAVGSAWDGRLQRIKRIAEAIEADRQNDDET